MRVLVHSRNLDGPAPPIPECVISAWLDTDIDRIEVLHDGAVTWDALQAIKNLVWGDEAVAIELFPPRGEVINTGNYRHLWRWMGDPKALPSMMDSGAR